MKTLALFALLSLPLAAEIPAELTQAAKDFLGSLDDAKRARAQLPFDHEDRENWRYTPRARLGLPLKDMTEAQKNAAVAVADAILSEKGEEKVAGIIALEGVLAALENNPEYRDQEAYYVTIFGEPGDPKAWAVRFEGHHLSVNVTLLRGKDFSLTPSFMGANPREVREGRMDGTRVLAAEEDLARTLVKALLEAGRKEVVFSGKAPAEILTGEERRVKQLEPVGITAASMTAAQREALMELISEYVGRYREEFAREDMEKIAKAGNDKIRFGWAGSTEADGAFYYRIQGPSFLMEAANTQNNANHLHTVWRDAERDFGRDLLGEHYDSPGHGHKHD